MRHFGKIEKSILHHFEKSKIDFAPFYKDGKIDYAPIYKEMKIDFALPKFGKKKESVAPDTVIKNLKTH